MSSEKMRNLEDMYRTCLIDSATDMAFKLNNQIYSEVFNEYMARTGNREALVDKLQQLRAQSFAMAWNITHNKTTKEGI